MKSFDMIPVYEMTKARRRAILPVRKKITSLFDR